MEKSRIPNPWLRWWILAPVLLLFLVFLILLASFLPAGITKIKIAYHVRGFKAEDSEVCRLASEELIAIGSPAVPALAEALRGDDRRLHPWAAETLGKIGPEAKEAVPVLMPAMKNEDSSVRRLVAEALGRIGSEAIEAVPVLTEALQDEDKEVRRSVVAALGAFGPAVREATHGLIRALEDPDSDVRQEAALALRKIGPEAKEGVPALMLAMKNEDPAVRRLVVEVLGRIGPGAREAVPVLTEALQDEDKEVRRLVAEALEAINPTAKEAAPALIETVRIAPGTMHQISRPLWNYRRLFSTEIGPGSVLVHTPGTLAVLRPANLSSSGEITETKLGELQSSAQLLISFEGAPLTPKTFE